MNLYIPFNQKFIIIKKKVIRYEVENQWLSCLKFPEN